MGQIIITKTDGSSYPLQSKGNVVSITRAEQTWELMNNDVVDVTIEAAVSQSFNLGDKLSVFGRDYKLNTPPKEDKSSNHKLKYDLRFEGVMYDLSRITYDVNIDTTGSDLTGDSLTADLKGFMDVLILNITRVFPGDWVLGDCPLNTETKTKTFGGDKDNCLVTLQSLCQDYGQEFEIVQSGTVKTIHIHTAGSVFPYTFKYGRGNGLYKLNRQKVNSSNIITRLKVYGSSDNITSKYRATKLCLPGKTKAQSYIEDAAAIAQYGVWEATKTFDNIKPSRIGSVTAIDATSELKFTDTTMFNLSETEIDGVTTKWLLPGTAAKVHFNSGNLAGYEFEVAAWDDATKTFTLKPFTDDRGAVFPSPDTAAFQIAIGDDYTILGITQPDVYVTSAENDLQIAGQAFYDQNKQPKVQYGLDVDPMYLKSIIANGETTDIFKPGDFIPIQDTDISVNKSIRVKSLTRDLIGTRYPYKYGLTLSDITFEVSNYVRIISDGIDRDKVLKYNRLKDPAKARRNWRSSQEVLDMVFDPSGQYYSGKIKPLSIETTMLAVGPKSMQFILENTLIEANYQANKNSVNVTGGTLTHYTIADTPKIWSLSSGVTALTTDATAYYIYAKCEKAGTAGTIIFSASQIGVDSDVNYYHFLVGIVNSVVGAVRAISLMYGATTVNGKFITTGVIQSSDGLTKFDLDNGIIQGQIKFIASDGTTVKNVNAINYSDVGADASGSAASAQSTAIATASADATAKVDAVQVGGANLHLNSSFLQGQTYWDNWVATTVDQTVLFNGNYTAHTQLLGSSVNTFPGMEQIVNSIDENSQYIVSVWFKSGGDSANDLGRFVRVNYLDASENSLGYDDMDVPNATPYVFRFFSMAVNTPVGTTHIKIRYNHRRNGGGWWASPKFERGNKATAWSPSPEDQKSYTNATASAAQAAAQSYADAQANLAQVTASSYADGIVSAEEARAIADAQAKADAALASAQTYADNSTATLQAALGAMAYEQVVGLAKLDATVIEGGYIKTTLINASALVIGNSQVTGLGALALVNSLSYSDVGADASGSAASAQTTAIATAAADATAKINAVQIGGTNLSGKSSCDNELPNLAYNSVKVISKLTTAYLSTYLKLTGDANASTDRYYQFGTTATTDEQGFNNADDFTVSFDLNIPTGMPTPFVYFYGYNGSAYTSITKNLSGIVYDVFKRYSVTSKFPGGSIGKFLRVNFPGATGDYFYIKNIKIERGNKSTDWSPAPEDQTAYTDAAQTAAQSYAASLAAAKLDAVINGQTVIVNGYLNTQFIEAASIVASKINFDGATGVNVNLSGAITATSGSIGGINILSGSIASANGNFKLTSTGGLVAKSATIYGSISNPFYYYHAPGGIYSAPLDASFNLYIRHDTAVGTQTVLLPTIATYDGAVVNLILRISAGSSRSFLIGPADSNVFLHNNQAIITLNAPSSGEMAVYYKFRYIYDLNNNGLSGWMLEDSVTLSAIQ